MMENLFAWYLGFIVLRIASAISAIEGSFPSQWVNDTYGGGHLCSEDLGVCRTFAHFVFVTTPSDASHILLGGAHFAFEDEEYQDGGSAISERHIVNGICSDGECIDLGESQMWNWGYDVVTKIGEPLPSVICAKIWMLDTETGETSSISPRCIPLRAEQTNFVNGSQGDISTVLVGNYSTAATSFCSDKTGKCRRNLHVVYSALSSQALTIMGTGGEYSWDGGVTWSGAGAVAFYEQHIDLKDETPEVVGGYYQALQFDVDIISENGFSDEPTEVCFRIWVQDSSTTEIAWIEKECIPVCYSLTYFHDPDGYCAHTSLAY